MRGLHFNAKCCYYNGVKVFGYTTEDLPIKAKGGGFKKAYTLDPVTSPVVRRIFEDYANGKPIKEIADDLNAQGLRTTKGGLFNVNGLRHILMNRMYLGEYRYGGIVVPDGVPHAFGLLESCFVVSVRNLCRVFQEHPNQVGFIITMFVRIIVDINASLDLSEKNLLSIVL